MIYFRKKIVEQLSQKSLLIKIFSISTPPTVQQSGTNVLQQYRTRCGPHVTGDQDGRIDQKMHKCSPAPVYNWYNIVLFMPAEGFR
jgi:hypothetical protein